MSLVTPTKIFVDPREEITFIIERILQAEKDRVIIVIPQNSLLLSSIISLKILKSRLANSAKLAILVTDDEYGKEIAYKVGLAVVSHVSEVQSDVWALAEQLKQEEISRVNQRKEDLLGKRKLEEGKEEETGEGTGEGTGIGIGTGIEGEEWEDSEVKEVRLSDTEVMQEYDNTDLGEEKDIAEDTGEGEDEEKVELISDDENVAKQNSEDEQLEKELKRYQKPRREAKEVTVDGITIIAGGDVRALHQKSKSDTIAPSNNTQDMKDSKKQETIGERPTREVTSFTGRDFTKKVSNQKNLTSTIASFFNFQPKSKRVAAAEALDPIKAFQKRRRRRIMIGAGVLGTLALLGFIWFYVTNVFSSVDIEITYTKEDVELSETIVASEDVEEIDVETLQIPALILTEDNLNTQVNGTATGEGVKGEKARGFLTFYNIDIETPVTIPTGTRITNVLNDLVFILQEDVVLEAVTYDELDTLVVPDPVDGVVEAENVGEEYNFGTGGPTTFVAQGFDKDSIQITRLLPFEGGSSETFVAVADSDVESVADSAKESLIEEGTRKLKAFVPNGYRLLEETIEFEEEEVRPFPNVGEEAEDGKFSFNLRGKLTAIAVREEDLEDITRLVLTQQSGGEEIPSLQDYEANLTNVVRDGNRVSFTIDSKGLFSNQKTNEELVELIKGKSVDEASRILADLEEVQDVTITYSPGFVPSNFQTIPSEEGRISITVQ